MLATCMRTYQGISHWTWLNFHFPEKPVTSLPSSHTHYPIAVIKIWTEVIKASEHFCYMTQKVDVWCKRWWYCKWKRWVGIKLFQRKKHVWWLSITLLKYSKRSLNWTNSSPTLRKPMSPRAEIHSDKNSKHRPNKDSKTSVQVFLNKRLLITWSTKL